MGPLKGVRVVEMAGIGPGPFCGMMLADMGADVLRIDRKTANALPVDDPVTARGRRSVALDLKQPAGVETVLQLVEQADILIEGYRPGVMERLGLGPETCLERNPRLVYGRMTGWGQDGPLAQAAGHDLNYIALAGALHGIGRPGERPVPPLNLVGDYGGGAMMLAFGVVCATLEARQSGQGQVVDSAMTDGTALLLSLFHGLRAQGVWSNERGTNLLDGGAPFYDTYTCADGRHISIGALEPQFYRELLERIGLGDDPDCAEQMNRKAWPAMRARFEAVFATRTSQEWCDILEGTDVCFAPVLDMDEAPEHPHHVARGTFVQHDGMVQAAPAPRFSRTRAELTTGARKPGEDTDTALTDWGIDPGVVSELREQGVC
ncbi:CaiB/BaiF CoA transferase family protein [Aquisalimonas asiatica]|uniref:Alpha-methylacyl-CoA racemase n=1 Tax=Aquisalimonas asiatica TaxID=406100 RepID=A0A1H8UU39_9GAMM|nr:CaiB/BaiF CoA-transferase family protein [Aquisalimonas asiatica]SEP06730.1 alpha-methylacyl-CoA racemase [Aquisalimonas asiatica]